MTHALAETSVRWAALMVPHAEALLKILVNLRLPDALAVSGVVPERRSTTPPTPLTQANRRRSGPQRTITASLRGNPVTARCVVCGVALSDGGRQYCDDCFATRRAEIEANFAPTGITKLAMLRAGGQDPAHGREAGKQRGQTNAKHFEATVEWKREHGNEPLTLDEFTSEMLPRLQSVSLVDLMAATGLSRRYCWLIKTGQKVPHRRHWQKLRSLTGGPVQSLHSC
jgi:hypothetical protein